MPKIKPVEDRKFDFVRISNTLRSEGVITEDDEKVVASLVSELMQAGGDQGMIKLALMNSASYFFSPSGLVKRLNALAEKYPMIKIGIPFISNFLNSFGGNNV
jgi:hypothetical protein